MGQFIKDGKHRVYQQDDGQTTAWFFNDKEIFELSHSGSTVYRRVFYVLVALGTLYLTGVFVFNH